MIRDHETLWDYRLRLRREAAERSRQRRARGEHLLWERVAPDRLEWSEVPCGGCGIVMLAPEVPYGRCAICQFDGGPVAS